MTIITTKEKTCCSCKQSLPHDSFNKNRSQPDGLQKACKQCKKKHSQNYRSKHPAQKQARQNKKKIRLDRQIYVLCYLLIHPCVDCGQSDPMLLDFDHVRGTKTYAISRMVSHLRSRKTIDNEIAKCEVRCVVCHRKKTAKEQGWYKNVDWESLKSLALQTVAVPKNPNRS